MSPGYSNRGTWQKPKLQRIVRHCHAEAGRKEEMACFLPTPALKIFYQCFPLARPSRKPEDKSLGNEVPSSRDNHTKSRKWVFE